MLAASALAEETPRYVVRAQFTKTPRIDGVLEPEWRRAEPVREFVQVSPTEGEPVSLPTELYVLYDDEALYIGFECHDTAPDSIAAPVQRRDNENLSDVVFVAIDSFHDRRTGYFFGLTAAGVQIDGTVADEDNFDGTWDGVWESAVTRSDSGWCGEMRLPFKSFRHGGARPDGWGIGFSRVILRRDENSAWPPFKRIRGPRVNEFGTLLGLENIPPSSHMEILPHAVSRLDAPGGGTWNSENNWDNLGLDLKLVPAGSWTVDLTLQPDFAQVDVDEEVINLSDYPVFLEERRPFFLEGLDLFQNTQIQLLYTRRITEPKYGGRLTGTWGPMRGSALYAKNLTEEGTEQDAAALRTLWNIGRQSNIGLTSTWLSDREFHAAAAAMDTRVRWGEENTFRVNFAGVDRTGGTGAQPIAAQSSLFLAHGKYRGSAWSSYRGREFEINDLGWTGPSNFFNTGLWLGYREYPETGPLQAYGPNLNYWFETLPGSSLDEWGGNINGFFGTRNNLWFGGGVQVGTRYRRNYVDEDEGETGAYSDNFGEFNPEYYPTQWSWAWVNTDKRKPVYGEVSIGLGRFRDGHSNDVSTEIGFRPTPNLEFNGEMNWNRVRHVRDIEDGRQAVFQVWRLRARWTPVLDLTLRSTVQYVKEDEELLVNTLLAWNWRPGSWLYAVYDEGRPFRPFGDSHPGDRTVRLKWTYFLTAS